MHTSTPLHRWISRLLLACVAWAVCSLPALAQTGQVDQGEYLIQRATYGTAQQRVDVTDKLRALAAKDQRFRMGNDSFGVDPAPGQVKVLRIEAIARNGQRRHFDYPEGSQVEGAQFTGWAQGQWGSGSPAGQGGPGGHWEQGERYGGWGNQGLRWVDDTGAVGSGALQIVRADFGTFEHSVDVTAALQALAQEGRQFQLVGTSFGQDPHPGVVKELKVTVRAPGGALRTLDFSEGTMVDARQFVVSGPGAPLPSQADSGSYQILQARYGTAERNIDVTERLRSLAAADQRFTMGNATFGTDPAPGQVKTLRIVARDNRGQTRNFDYREGSQVDGAQFTGWGAGQWGRSGWNGGWNGQAPAAGAGPLRIVNAAYGVGKLAVDVTSRLQASVRDNRIDVTVNNDLAGSDPAPNQPKSLWVSYTVGGGRTQQAQVNENGRLSLP